MTNQAAQTMPELPKPFQKAVIANRINTTAVRQGYEAGGYEKSPDLYTADQTHQYARDYAAALSQTAGAAAPGRYFADGPQGHFFADDLQLARDLVNLYDKDDDWTITDLRNPTGTAPAASGGEYPECSGDPVSCPENEGHGCCKPNPKCSCPSGDGSLDWPCKAHPPSYASVSERARALLAAQYRAAGFNAAADWIAEADMDAEENNLDRCVIRAIEQALTQQRGEPVAWRFVTENRRHGPQRGHWRDVKDAGMPPQSEDLADGVTVEFAYTTPQPSADAVRELVKRWRDEAAKIRKDEGRDGDIFARVISDMADELESLLSGGSHA